MKEFRAANTHKEEQSLSETGATKRTAEFQTAEVNHQVFNSLSIRSLNHDNQVEINRLVNLYERTYDHSYPFQNVYNPNFWARQGESLSRSRKHIDILAVDGQSFVGHLGFRLDKLTRFSELAFIALAPENRGKIFSISRAAWKTFLRVAHHQNCRGVYHYCPISHPATQIISVKCFNTKELAILPGYIPASNIINQAITSDKGRISVLAMHSQLSADPSSSEVLYPPDCHRQFIERLYASISYPVRFAQTENLQCTKNKLHSSAVESLKSSLSPKGMRVEYRRRFAVCNVFLQPSSIVSLSEVLASVKNLMGQQKQVYLLLALDDPRCAPFCQSLEYSGFRFSGILPPIAGCHYIIYSVFSNETLQNLVLYSAQAKDLRSYLIDTLKQ